MRTFSYCKVMFCTKCGSEIGNEYHFCSKCGHKTRPELTDSVLSQLQDSIWEKDSFKITSMLDIITKLLLCSFIYATTLMSVKETLERRLSYYGFWRRGFSNVTINKLKNVIQSEIQGSESMGGYHRFWHSLKTNYGIIVEGDIVMNIWKEIDPKGTNMWKACCLRRK